MAEQIDEPLRFIDHRRQAYAGAAPTREAGEFIVGSYEDDGRLTEDGEFRVTLIELTSGGHWALHPHIEAFRDGTGSLRRAIEAGLLDVLSLVADNEEFSRRLIAIGLEDRSDQPLSQASGGGKGRRGR